MVIELDISTSDLAEQIRARFEEVKVPIQAAMAGRFREIVLQNFGETGTDRPVEWEALRSKRYAKKVGRDYATLYVSGKLMDSVKIDPYNQDGAVVSTDCKYANTHQWGDESRNIAERPFFPITKEGNITPYAESQVIEAAQNEVSRLFR